MTKMSKNAEPTNELSSLPLGEQFLLWALRNWVRAHKTDCHLHETLRRGFVVAGIEDGYLAIDELLTIIATSATTTIDVRCPRCGGISPDEQIFLGVIASLQRSDFASSSVLLGHWLAPAGVRIAQTPAGRLARSMTFAGLPLRRLPSNWRRPEPKLAGENLRPRDQVPPPTVH